MEGIRIILIDPIRTIMCRCGITIPDIIIITISKADGKISANTALGDMTIVHKGSQDATIPTRINGRGKILIFSPDLINYSLFA